MSENKCPICNKFESKCNCSDPLDGLGELWVSEQSDIAKADNTVEGYEYGIRRFTTFLKTYQLTYEDIDRKTDIELDTDDLKTDSRGSRNLVDLFILWLRDVEKYAKSTVKTTYYEVRPFITFLVENGHVEFDPVDSIKLSDYVPYDFTVQDDEIELETKAVKPEEHAKMRLNVPGNEFRNRLILDVFFETGMRRKEMSLLDVSDIDGRKIDIPPVKFSRANKVPDSHPIWVSSTLAKNLEIWKKVERKAIVGHSKTNALWPQDGRSNSGRLSPKSLNQIVKQSAENAEIQSTIHTGRGGEYKRLTAHSYRHCFAFRCLENGMDIYTVAQMMNHSSATITEMYIDESEDYLRSQIDQHRPTFSK
jgi:site-specific recombinase XerD